ncbi:uncharacterized protein LOC123536270 [Mercenaria mercenaria]|uniref:uncharacterized protein LOC123536270 n=1 Tax=Mercenaria mercenaria TaxID=6596 RepID=UPI00234F2D56|nr:uncharacterized protein LOC123536270 [Mercenaria mercenaria]
MAAQYSDLPNEERTESDKGKQAEDFLCTSDEYHDITCTLCSKERRNVAATKYCVECANYLCGNCVEQHNKFSVMKSHRIVDKAAAKQHKSDQNIDLPVQKCDKHHGKLLDMYCKNHEEVCCAACAAIDHSTCKGMVYLPNMVKELDYQHNLEDTFCWLSHSRMKMAQLKLARIKHFEAFEYETKEIIEEKKCIRQRLDTHFDDLENKLKKDIEQERVIFKAVTDNEVKKFEETISALDDQKQTLERFRESENAASIFVQTKIASKYIKEAEKVEKLTEGTPEKRIYFLPNRELNRILDLTSLGKTVENIPACSTELLKVISIKTSKEKSVPTYSGICSLEDGSTLICDWQNQSLKRLDEKYRVIEHLHLPGQPYDICKIDASTVAVTLPKMKKVRFVSTENQMKLTSSFETVDACRGITYVDGLIYIASGGWKIFKEGPGHIEIYNASGELYSSRFDQHLSQLGHISIYGSRLYVASNDGLIIMDADGLVSKIFTHRDMHNPLAVCVGPGNLLFVGGWSSHNVMLLHNEGQLIQLLLSQKNGIKDLHTLYYDKIRSRLIYTMRDSNKIKIYDLMFKT